jgi:DNA-binding HxlR family transcriptional regulator
VTVQKLKRSNPKVADSADRPAYCRAVSSVLALIGDKWSVLVIVKLGDGLMRFNEIKRVTGGISQRMLTLTLRGLEREGLVARTQYATIPPRVDYELTALGRALWQVVQPLGAWACAHVEDMNTARAQFDEKSSVVVIRNSTELSDSHKL